MRYISPRFGLSVLLCLLFASACGYAPDLTATSTSPVHSPDISIWSPTLQPSATPIVLPIDGGSLLERLGEILDRMPPSGSNEYIAPTVVDRAAFANVTRAILAGDFLTAHRITNEQGYSITEYTDNGDDEAVDFLLEETAAKRGWGWFVFRKDPQNELIIEAPHPIADMDTHLVALDAYRALDARALLVAGAHRDANTDGSADVSHTPGSIFQVVHTVLVTQPYPAQDTTIVLQIHGFDSAKHKRYPDVVLGYDLEAPSVMTAYVQTLKEALILAGVEVGVCDGNSWEALCGTRDVLNSIPTGRSLHIELNESIREHDKELIQALIQVFAARLQ